MTNQAIDQTIEQALTPSKEDWKEPLWTKFKAFCWGFGKAVALIALCLWLVLLYQGSKEHAAKVSSIQNPPSGSPEIGASPSAKIAPKGKNIAIDNIATQAINTPAIPNFSHEKAPKQPEPLTPAEQDFANRLATFESKL